MVRSRVRFGRAVNGSSNWLRRLASTESSRDLSLVRRSWSCRRHGAHCPGARLVPALPRSPNRLLRWSVDPWSSCSVTLPTADSRESAGDIPDYWRSRGSSVFADSRFYSSTQRLGRANLVKQPPCEAVLGLTRHRKEQVLGSDEAVVSGHSEFAGLPQEFFDVAGEFTHGRIMTNARRTFPNTDPREGRLPRPSAVAALKGKSFETGWLDSR